ncbi:MAG: glutathione S-transferase, partial [Amylibacter sp.]
ISQSGVIQDYITQQTGKFGGQTDADRREVLRWILWDNHKLSSQAGMLRFLMNFLPQEKRPTMVFPFFESRLKDAYTVLDTHFKHNKWITADYPTMAGFSCCGHLYYP